MTNDVQGAPERVYIGQESYGRMAYQWFAERAELAHWEIPSEDYSDAPRGRIVEYVRVDLLEAEQEEHRHTQGALDYANETLRVTSSAERADRLRLEAEVKRLTVERSYWHDAAETGRDEGYKQGTEEMEAERTSLFKRLEKAEERAERAERVIAGMVGT